MTILLRLGAPIGPGQLVLVEDGKYVRRPFGAEDELELVDAFVAVQVQFIEDGAGERARVHGNIGLVLASHRQDRLSTDGVRSPLFHSRRLDHDVLMTRNFYNLLLFIRIFNIFELILGLC